MNDQIFTVAEAVIFDTALWAAKKAARAVPLMVLAAIIDLALVIGIGLIDYELYLQVFRYASGDEAWWNAELMALTAMIMLVSFHILARQHPNHRLIKLISASSATIIAAFAAGGGLFLAVVIYRDGLQDVLVSGASMISLFGEAEAEQSWVDWVFEHLTGPVGVLALSAGIGGISVISLFAGHHLLSALETNVRDSHARTVALKAAKGQYQTIQDCEAQFAAGCAHIDELTLKNREHWCEQIASEALQARSDALAPHEAFVQHMEFTAHEHRWKTDESQTVKSVKAAVKKIRAIKSADIHKALAPTKRTSQ